MRNYWLKIAAGAFGIFAVGMVLITGFRSVKSKVTSTLNSTEPIPLPLMGLVPFKLDSARLGSVSRVELLRNDPQHVSGVRVLVKLADSVQGTRLTNCRIALEDVDNLDERTTFLCQPTALEPAGLEPFGVVVVRNSGDSFPLLLPSRTVTELRATSFEFHGGGVHVTTHKDRTREHFRQHADSLLELLSDRIEARGDSVEALRDQAADLEDAAADAPLGKRRQLQKQADSVRQVMRATLDRMKADEGRLKIMTQVVELSPRERDSLAQLGTALADSVRRTVIRELVRVQQELEQAGVSAEASAGTARARATAGAGVSVEAPAPPPPPKP